MEQRAEKALAAKSPFRIFLLSDIFAIGYSGNAMPIKIHFKLKNNVILICISPLAK